ncbi:uncharacterized protein LOC134186601 [Corticium candelabrum]|uniref:uncharacterized protein LOC134186601 n=1 Tax=Corticium candelabrum TaxID=121492 RepID=UPI002E2707BB|nr:uncharacterized protein LOC134186601 [Corticium candelabrum]
MAMTVREVDVTTSLVDYVLACQEDIDKPEVLRERLKQKDAELASKVLARSPGIEGIGAATCEEQHRLEARVGLVQFLKSQATTMDDENKSVGTTLCDEWLKPLTTQSTRGLSLVYEHISASTENVLKRGQPVVNRVWSLLSGLRWAVIRMKEMVADQVITEASFGNNENTLRSFIEDDLGKGNGGGTWSQEGGDSSWKLRHN